MNRFTSGIAAALIAAGTSAGAVSWTETVDGDLSNDPLAPTLLTLGLGTHTVTGSVTTPADTRDYMTFTIAPGQLLTSILLQEYLDGLSGGPGNRGYHAISWGAASAIPGGATANDFLAGAHLDPLPPGSDLLAQLQNSPTNGTGLTAPLGAGTYTYLVQQTGPQVSNYVLDFVVTPVPVPGAGVLMAGLLGLGVAFRRRS